MRSSYIFVAWFCFCFEVCVKIVCVVHGGARGARFFSCFRCQMSAEVGGRGLQHHGSQSAVQAAVRPGVRMVGGWTLTPYPAVSMSDALSGARCPQIERTGGNTRLCSTIMCVFCCSIKQYGFVNHFCNFPTRFPEFWFLGFFWVSLLLGDVFSFF